jgi:UDP-4-amino-4-deoxy-L-arabinose formyltransferase/UDP-glucuronic acid dehydrogenase (UDP-4-keto-hexauronic acid decarboxylating)
MAGLRCCIIGYHEVACTELDLLIKYGFDPVLVVPNKRRIGQINDWYRDIEQLALSYGVPIHKPASLRSPDTIRFFSELNIDLLFSGFSSFIFPEELLAVPRVASLNFHNSILPHFRGRAAPIRQLQQGIKSSAMTLHLITKGVDEGPIVDSEPIAILDSDTIYDLYLKFNYAQYLILDRFLPDYLSTGVIKSVPQSGIAINQGTWSADIQNINFYTQGSFIIDKKVRSLAYPFPGADTVIREFSVKIHSGRPLSSSLNITKPGCVIDFTDTGVIVGCKAGMYEIINVEFKGRHILGRHFLHIIGMRPGGYLAG